MGVRGNIINMKLIQLFKYYWPDNGGGIAKSMDMLSLAFEKWSLKNNCVSENDRLYNQRIIVCWRNKNKSASKGRYHEIPIYRCKTLFEFASTQVSSMYIRAVDRLTKEDDLVIYNFPYPMVDLCILLGKIHGKIVVWWHCDFDTHKGAFISNLYRLLVKNTLNKADKILVSARGNITGSELLSQYESKCTIIPFAIHDDILAKGRKYYQNRTPRNKIDKVHVLFVGRFVWYKGLEYLMKAFEKLDSGKYELTLVGDGEYLDKIKKISGDKKNITITGNVTEDEKFRWIEWCHFLVLPSISVAEAFAIVQIEAMAYGKPVINTNLKSGVPDVSIDKKTGITVEPKSSEELMRAIKILGEEIETCEKYGREAIGLVSEKYSMSKLIANYGRFFDELISSNASS